MALNLDLSYSQSNDAVTLTITDIAGTYVVTDNEDGWGAPNPAVTDIVASTVTTVGKYHLKLSVVVTDKNNLSTTYDTIDLYDHDSSGPFVTAADLTWNFTPASFISGGTAMGLSTDKLTDGTYAITYKLVDAPTDLVVTDSVIESILVDGDVRIDVYNKLRQVPVDYDNENNDMSRDIMEALLAYSYLQSIEASASVSMTEEISTMLYTLDKLVSDGSNYTW
jgi:hypothetical protein